MKYFLVVFVVAFFPIQAELSSRSAAGLLQRSYREDDVKAVHTLVQAEKIDPDHVAVLFRIGFLMHKMNRRKEATEYYKKVLLREKCHERALNNLAGLTYDEGDHQGAKRLYEQSISCNESFYLPHYNLANLLEKDQNLEESLFHYEKSIHYNPTHSTSYHNAGLIYFRLAKRETVNSESKETLMRRAAEYLEKSVELSDRDGLNRLNLAIVYESLQEYEKALKSLEQSERFSLQKNSRLEKIREIRDRISKKRTEQNDD